MSGPEHPDLPRDDALDAAWRAHSTELPPRHLDAAILASAHREAHARPHAIGDDDALAEAREPSRAWWVLAAAATIGAIAFGIVHLAPGDAPTTPTVATDMPANVAGATPERTAPSVAGRIARDHRASADASNEQAKAAPRSEPSPAGERQAEGEKQRASSRQAPAERKSTQAVPAPRAPASPSATTASGKRDAPASAPEPSPPVLASAPPASAPAAAAPPPPDTLAVPQESAATGAGLVSQQPRPFPGGTAPAATGDLAKRERAAEQATPGEAPAPAAADARRRDETTRLQEARKSASAPALRANIAPDAWVRRIVTLYEAGERAEAERELRAFRGAYPDADDRLPASLRAWAAGVKRD